jgi:hypothetical protein
MIDGMTLRQRLMHEYQHHLEGKEPSSLGASYYERIRAIFKPKNSITDLEVADATLIVSPRLVQAVFAARRAHPDRGPLIAWMQTVSALNQSEMCGLMRFLPSLKFRCLKQLACSMEAIRMCSRLRLPVLFEKEFRVLKPWVDEVLEFAVCRSRSAHTEDATFCSQNRDLLALVLPAADLDKVLKHGGSFVAVQDELTRLVAGAAVGLKLFSASIHSLVGTGGIKKGARSGIAEYLAPFVCLLKFGLGIDSVAQPSGEGLNGLESVF